jgi:hypothetical protein
MRLPKQTKLIVTMSTFLVPYLSIAIPPITGKTIFGNE